MSGLFVPVPQHHILTSGANSALTWTNAVSVSSLSASTLNASNLTVSTLATSSSVTTSTLTTGRLNYSSIVGSSISTNSMTLSLTNASTQNTQIYQVATTNPTTSYTAIQASHVSTGTTNNALVLNPSGGNVGVGTTSPGTSLNVIGSTDIATYPANAISLFQATKSVVGVNDAGIMVGSVNGNTPYLSDYGSGSVGMAIYTNKAERMRILANGNVGIGTQAPAQLLDITNATSLTPAIRIQNQFSAGYVSMGANVGVNSFIGLQATQTTTSSLTTPALAVTNNGNIGIGTTNPSARLHVVGSGGSGSPFRLVSDVAGNEVGMGFYRNPDQSIPATGDLWVMGTTAWGVGDRNFGIGCNGTNAALTLLANGRVGMGTTAPTSALQVSAANANDTTTLTISNNDNSNTGFGARLLFDNFGGMATLGSIAALRSNNSANFSAHMAFSVNLANSGSLTERMRITADGNVGIGTTAPSARLDVFGSAATSNIEMFRCVLSNGNQILSVFATANTTNGGWNGSDTVLRVTRDVGTNRSINTAGTINASGADYAEYMTKDSDFPAQKGDLLGVLPSGKLTNQFDDAIHFLLKSTNPCMVGGDVWGTEAIVGEKPKEPENATEEEKAAHAAALAAWEARLEAERQKVDRMAFAGQVPVNIQGTTPGDYIIPLRNADGTIGVAAVSKADMTFSQYQSAVGRVISILADGRANVIVKAV